MNEFKGTVIRSSKSTRRSHRIRALRKIFGVTIAVLLLFPVSSEQSYADPPPWAPAHGYYKKKGPKHKDKSYAGTVEIVESGFVSEGRCNREDIGKALGAVLGGVVGAKVTEGDSRPVGVIAGAILGYIVGGSIGRSMDERDRACVGQALEYAEDQESITWQNPDQQTTYRVTPTSTYQKEGAYCREYTREAVVNDQRQTVVGEACRQPDGSWQIVR